MRGTAVSRRVINYPDSFGATPALLSIKLDSRTRQFPSPVIDGDRDARAVAILSARPFAKRD